MDPEWRALVGYEARLWRMGKNQLRVECERHGTAPGPNRRATIRRILMAQQMFYYDWGGGDSMYVVYSKHGPEAVFDDMQEANEYLDWLGQTFAAYRVSDIGLHVAPVPHNPGKEEKGGLER